MEAQRRKTFARLFHHMGHFLDSEVREVQSRDPANIPGLHRHILYVIFYDVYHLTATGGGQELEFTSTPTNESDPLYFGTVYTAAVIEAKFQHLPGLIKELREKKYEMMVRCTEGAWLPFSGVGSVIPYPGKN